ncbi:MAG: glycosyltransferase family 4 protein, partial [Elusimicrobiota bacterium]|nr:glycosyltransferase family 4 protein [Endomicrobiia bacterium]MDW8166698.1 glycosyltransferase family 4 protein [Elusimicrobiota bacterium]
MEKIKICHITTVHSPFDVRIFHKECKTLAKAGYEVYLIAQNDKEEIVDGIHIIPLPKIMNRLERIIKLPFIAFKCALKIDAKIYHLHDPELLLIGLLLKIYGKTVIFDSHEDFPLQFISKPYLNKQIRIFLSILLKIFENISCRFFNTIITATPSIRNKFLKINSKTIDVNNFPLLKESLLIKDNNNKRDKNEICYIGGISKIRGIKELIRALELLDDVRLNLAGNFEDNKLEEEVKSLDGWEKVNYYGFVDRDKVYEIISRSSIGIVTLHPSINYIDSLPVKMFEYMLGSLPVIASNFPLWKKIVEDNNCGICVDPLNPKEIANAIKYILD